MNLFTGTALLVLAAALFLNCRPRAQESRVLCLLTGAMGLMALIAGDGSWRFQLIQTALQAFVALCCVMRVRREKRFRARRAALRRGAHTARGRRDMRSCA